MSDVIEKLTGAPIVEQDMPAEEKAAWGKLVYERFKAQSDISLEELLHALGFWSRRHTMAPFLRQFFLDDPHGYPEIFAQFSLCFNIRFWHLDAQYNTNQPVDFLIGMGLPTVLRETDKGKFSESPLYRFWKAVNGIDNYWTVVRRLLKDQVTEPSRRREILHVLLRPEVGEGTVGGYHDERAKASPIRKRFLRDVRFSAHETGLLETDLPEAIFSMPYPMIQDRYFSKMVMVAGHAGNFPKPLPAMTAGMARVYLLKFILGMKANGTFGPIPGLDERRKIIAEARNASLEPDKITDWEQPFLETERLNLNRVWQHIKDKDDRFWSLKRGSEDFSCSLFLELISFGIISGEYPRAFEYDDCLDFFRNNPITCIYEAWHTLTKLKGRPRDILFSRLWPLLPLDRMIEKWPDWFEQLLVDEDWKLDDGFQTQLLPQIVMRKLHCFSEALRNQIITNLLKIDHSNAWLILGDYFNERFFKEDDVESPRALVRMLIDQESPALETIRKSTSPDGYWPSVIYFFFDHALANDPESVRFWISRFVELVRDCDYSSEFKTVLELMQPYLLEQDYLVMAESENWRVRQILCNPMIKLGGRKALARVALFHWDEDTDVAVAASDSFVDARFDGHPAYSVKGPDGDTPLPDWLIAEGNNFAAWTEALGKALLGRKTELNFFSSGLGQTRVVGRREDVTIQVNPLSFFEGHPDGESIVKGLILHEIGHHFWDIGQPGFKAMWGIAKSRNVKRIYDILIDERLERGMRRVVPESAAWFDRLASFAFAQKVHRVPLSSFADLEGANSSAELVRMHHEMGLPGTPVVGTDPPGVELTTVELFNLPKFDFPLVGFLYALRGGMPLELFRDPRVARAVRLVPKGLSSLPHKEVLQLAIAIADELEIDTSPNGKTVEDKFREVLENLQQLGELLQRILDDLGPYNRQALDGLVSKAVSDQTPNLFEPDSDEGNCLQSLPEICKLEGIPNSSTLGKPAGKFFNAGPGKEFKLLQNERELEKDPSAHEALFKRIAPHIRRMRSFLQNMVEEDRELPASLRGRRIDLAAARQAAVRPQIRLLIGHEKAFDSGAYIGILIDNSSSMDGKKSEKAKAFGMLIAEAAKGIRQIEGHVNAFDQSTFIRLGDFRQHAIATLDPRGGNNDAGGLARAAELALASRKRHRLIIMINDDSPTASTAKAVKELVANLTKRHGMVLTQVAVDKLRTGAFPHFVDFSKLEFDAAVAEFGKLLRRMLRRS